MDAPRPTIAHVLHRLYLAGAEVLAADLARQLQQDYRFVFFCLDDVGPLGMQLRDEGFEVVNLGRRPGIDLRTSWRLRRAVRRLGVDLLHAHQYTPFFYAGLSRGLGSHPPVIFTEHGRHYPDARSTKRVWANRLLLKPTDRITAVGKFIRQALIDNEGLEPGRIEVIYNGIDPDRFSHDNRDAARQAMQVGPDDLVVLQVARFHPVKDHQTALHAFAYVVEKLSNARLVLIGDGEERPAIEATIEELGLDHHVRLLGVRDDVAQLLHGADLFMLSSLSEGISVTLLEAMAAHLPIVATDVGGNPEVVEHGRNGLLSPRADAQALATNLLTLLTNAPMCHRAGEAGHHHLRKHFTQARMHRAYDQLYRQMLKLN